MGIPCKLVLSDSSEAAGVTEATLNVRSSPISGVDVACGSFCSTCEVDKVVDGIASIGESVGRLTSKLVVMTTCWSVAKVDSNHGDDFDTCEICVSS